MAIGIVNRDEFEKEKSRYKELEKESHPQDAPAKPELITPDVVPLNPQGRSKGDNNIPESLRKILAETALMDGRSAAMDIARSFGVSSSSVSAYSNGATSTATYKKPHKRLAEHIKKNKEAAIYRAQRTMRQALNNITEEKLAYSEAKDLSGIAKDMSVIIKNLEPDKQNEVVEDNRVQFTIYAPQFRQENSYEVIDHSDE